MGPYSAVASRNQGCGGWSAEAGGGGRPPSASSHAATRQRPRAARVRVSIRKPSSAARGAAATSAIPPATWDHRSCAAGGEEGLPDRSGAEGPSQENRRADRAGSLLATELPQWATAESGASAMALW